jgi:hypothetical protein
MGSTYEVKFVAKAAAAAVQALVRTELDAYDAAFSQWRDDSEIARFNRQTTTEPIAVSSRFESVLRQALAAAALTEGAFDPTVKPLTDLYRARKLDPEHRLDAAAAAAALARVGFRRVAVVDGAVVKGSADVTIDLDGIAAGAAADSRSLGKCCAAARRNLAYRGSSASSIRAATRSTAIAPCARFACATARCARAAATATTSSPTASPCTTSSIRARAAAPITASSALRCWRAVLRSPTR